MRVRRASGAFPRPSWRASTVVVLLAGGTFAHPLAPRGEEADFEVVPQRIDAPDPPEESFDRRWILPARRSGAGPDLLADMRGLLEARFDIELAGGRRYRCVGDLVTEARALGREARSDWFAEVERNAADWSEGWADALEQLLLDSKLHTDDWSPSDGRRRDGLLLTESWDMRPEGPPWSEIDVRPRMEQAAALIHADLATIKSVENDYRLYPSNVGADYEMIFPVEGSYKLGSDGDGRPYSTLALRFRCDLPFPFSDYTTDLRILNRFQGEFAGEPLLHTDIYSTSEDFYWLAGRDVFLPVKDSAGECVAFLVVRHFGFDLDGVPDGSDARREALRGSIGNLKRNAERLRGRNTRGSIDCDGLDVLESVRVQGRR